MQIEQTSNDVTHFEFTSWKFTQNTTVARKEGRVSDFRDIITLLNRREITLSVTRILLRLAHSLAFGHPQVQGAPVSMAAYSLGLSADSDTRHTKSLPYPQETGVFAFYSHGASYN